MSFKDQVINLIIQGRDLFSSEAAKSEKALQELANQSEVLNERLDDLKQQQAAIKAIDDLTAAITKGEKGFIDGSRALEQFSKEQKQAAQNLKQLEQAQKEAATSTSKLENEYSQTVAKLSQYDEQLAAARAEVERLTATQDKGAQASKDQAQALAAANADLQQLETAQKNTATSAKQLATELEQERIELKQLSSEVDQAGQKKAEYALKVKGARTELNQLGSSLGRNKAELDKQQTVLNKAGIDMNKLADASKDLKTQQAAAEIAIKGVNTRLERHNKLLDESKKSSSDFGGSIKAATGSLIAMAGAYVGVDRLWESLKSILTAGDKAASFSAQMTAMMGSIAGGEQATAWIKDFANRTGTQLDSAKQAFASLKTFGIDPMNGALQSMVDYNAKLGGSQEKLEGIILATGQAWAKQKLQGEEILQLVERGVPVWDLLEKVTGKNTVQLGKLSEAGKLGRDVMQQLFDEMGKQANGQAALSLERLSGQLNLLSNKWESFKQIIADSGAYQVAIDLLKDINTSFDQLNQSGKIKAAAQDISDFFKAILKDGGASLKGMLENITAFATGLNVVAGSIRLVFNALSIVVSGFGAAVIGAFSMFPLGMSKALSIFGENKLSRAFQYAADGMLEISKAYIAQVKKDAEDAKAALEQVGFEIRSESDKNTDTQVKNAEKVKDAIKSEAEARLSTYQQDVEISKKLLDVADENVKSWELRTNAAGEYYRTLLESGTASQKELATAQAALEGATLKLYNAQKLQQVQQDEMTDSTAKLKVVTMEMLKSQSELADTELVKVRDAFIAGQASIEDYKTAQDNAKTSADALTQAQKDLAGETDKAAVSAKEYEAAMAKAGITTVKALKDQEEAAKNTFEEVKKGAKEGIASAFEVEQAYTKWAEAALKTAAAQSQGVPETLKSEAAANKLTGTLNDLVSKNKEFSDSTKNTSTYQQQFVKEVENTEKAISKLSDIIKSSSATDKEKAAAQLELIKRKRELTVQTSDLVKVQEIESANYQQLKGKQEQVVAQLEALDLAYKKGNISAKEYNDEKERLMKLLQVILQLLGLFGDEQEEVDDKTDKTNQTLREQQIELEKLEQQTGRATEYLNLFASAQEHLNKEFDFSSKSTEELSARYRDLEGSILRNQRVTMGFWGELARLSNIAFKHEQEIISATLQYRKMEDQLKSNTLTLKQLDDMTYRVNNTMSALDDVTLENLRNGIQSARDSMAALRDDLSETLGDLRDELDELNGKKKDAELEQLNARKKELESKIDAAQRAGDRAAITAAKQALSLAQQIYDTKKRQQTTAKQEAEQADKQSAAEAKKQAEASAATAKTTAQNQATATVNTQANTQTTTQSVANTSDMQVLQLQVGNSTFNAQMKRSLVTELMNEIKRLQSVGG
ncbi:tape measure protein [Shewanella baltica]|uniref:tape measure protein n=1 Tax=Shewanella baltica TaxID=62322 RepID=UPI00287147E2|nr:tape measure protein [Shewanella baltica]MDR9766604.1 tape measure protein [Shewanella baltica]